MKPRYNEGPRGLAKCVCSTEVLLYPSSVFFFITFYYYYGKENRSSYRGLHYIEALYIEVPTVHTKMERDGLSVRLSSLLHRHHCPENK